MVNRFIKELSRSMSCQLPAQLPAICCRADPFYRDSRPAETLEVPITIVLDTINAQIEHYFLKIIFVHFRML